MDSIASAMQAAIARKPDVDEDLRALLPEVEKVEQQRCKIKQPFAYATERTGRTAANPALRD